MIRHEQSVGPHVEEDVSVTRRAMRHRGAAQAAVTCDAPTDPESTFPRSERLALRVDSPAIPGTGGHPGGKSPPARPLEAKDGRHALRRGSAAGLGRPSHRRRNRSVASRPGRPARGAARKSGHPLWFCSRRRRELVISRGLQGRCRVGTNAPRRRIRAGQATPRVVQVRAPCVGAHSYPSANAGGLDVVPREQEMERQAAVGGRGDSGSGGVAAMPFPAV